MHGVDIIFIARMSSVTLYDFVSRNQSFREMEMAQRSLSYRAHLLAVGAGWLLKHYVKYSLQFPISCCLHRL